MPTAKVALGLCEETKLTFEMFPAPAAMTGVIVHFQRGHDVVAVIHPADAEIFHASNLFQRDFMGCSDRRLSGGRRRRARWSRPLRLGRILPQTGARSWKRKLADIADDDYRRFRDDIAPWKTLGLQAYRFSIAWPRVIPRGTGKANAKGVAFYDKLIDALLAAGIEPWITLFHWDYPQELISAEDGSIATRRLVRRIHKAGLRGNSATA